MVNIGGDLEGLPPGAEVIEAPRVQRQVEYSVWPRAQPTKNRGKSG